MTQKLLKIVMLCADQDFENIFRRILADYKLEVISGFDLTRNIAACWERICRSRFDILILTNFGISAYDMIECVKLLPENRGYRAVVMTGHLDLEMANVCIEKNVPLAKFPLEAEEIRALVSGRQ